MKQIHSRSVVRAAALALVFAASLAPLTARAWWRGGVWIGVPPVVVAPPVVAYPPAYYPPPDYAPGYYAPPPGYAYPPPAQPAPQQTPAPQISQGNAPFGTTCYAGFYTCAAPAQTQVGTGCSCPGIGAPSYGVVQ